MGRTGSRGWTASNFGLGTGYSGMGARRSGREGRCLCAINNYGCVGFPPGFDDPSAKGLCSEVRDDTVALALNIAIILVVYSYLFGSSLAWPDPRV